MIRLPPNTTLTATLFPYTPLFRSRLGDVVDQLVRGVAAHRQDRIRVGATLDRGVLRHAGAGRDHVLGEVGRDGIQPLPAFSVGMRQRWPEQAARAGGDGVGGAGVGDRERGVDLVAGHARPRGAVAGQLDFLDVVPGDRTDVV